MPKLRDPRLAIVQGEGQSDVTFARLDKASGLALLTDRLHAPLALAVGDSAPDLGMLGAARSAWAPRNADRAVRAAGVPRTRHGYQLGLLEAVEALVGHRVGGCPRCVPPVLSDRTRPLLALLGVREAGLAALPSRTLRLAVASARADTR